MPLLRSGVMFFAQTTQERSRAPGEKPSKQEGHPTPSLLNQL